MAIRLTLRNDKPRSKRALRDTVLGFRVLWVSIGGVFTSSPIALERVKAFPLKTASDNGSRGGGGIALVGDVLCLNRSVDLIGKEPWGTSVPSSIPLGRVQRRRAPTRYYRNAAASRALVGAGTTRG